MASIDLLEELKLHEYFPQQLSYSDAIKLRGRSQNGCQDLFGLDIVKKLLMFDFKAIDAVVNEISDRLKNTSSKETETENQLVFDGIRTSRKGKARPTKARDKDEQNQRKLHPMDLLVVAMNCCDDFLRQVLIEKMVANKLSIPILLPDVRNGSPTLLKFALRSLFPEVPDPTPQVSATALNNTLIDIKNPFVSFIRIGNLRRSKSKVVNDLLGFNTFNTFFHRECPNGSAKRSVSNGSIEAAWFQSSKVIAEEFNCTLFTALNLRGNAKDYPKQTQFLSKSSMLVVFMVEAFQSFKELYENVLEDIGVSQTKIIVCYISNVSPESVDETYLEFLDDLTDRDVISEVIYNWKYDKEMSDVDFTRDLRKTISILLKPEHGGSYQMPTYTSIMERGKRCGFLLDEDKLECKTGTSSAEKFVDLLLKQSPDCKPMILPLQGGPWEEIGRLEREQPGRSQNSNQDEYFIAERDIEIRRQRKRQCLDLIGINEVIQTFSFKFHLLQEQSLCYFLNSCKINLDARSRVITSKLLDEYKKEKQQYPQQLSNEEEHRVKLRQIELKIENSKIGLEHIQRECGQMYEAVISEEICMKETLGSATLPPDTIRNFPSIVAKLLLKGQSLELMDGDASNVPITWLKAVLNQVRLLTNNAKVFVLSIIGVQSSGKSTLLNALFGLQFPVSAGRCTRGIYCHLVPIDERSLIVEYDYILVVDTEGLGASEFSGNSTFRDNELATFAIGLADATIINMKGENWAEIKDILQIVAYGLIRIRKTKMELGLMPRCMFVHQNVPAADAEEKNRLGQEKELMLLDTAIKAAARAEDFTNVNKFDDVIKYDPSSHSWYFPDLWNGTPPKARISQDYIGKANELRQYIIQLMRNRPNSSKFTISSFVLRMSDLWNAMLHNDFVFCFRNTHEIIAGTVLNDGISNEVDSFKSLNKFELKRIRELICSFESVQEFNAEKEEILKEASEAVEKNFTIIKITLQEAIDKADICEALKQKYEILLNTLKNGELRRINDETTKCISVHMKKLEIGNDERVKDLRARLTHLERHSEEVEKSRLTETDMKQFEESWQLVIADNKTLVDERIKMMEREIAERIRGEIQKSSLQDVVQLDTVDWENISNCPFVDKKPQVTENDIVKSKQTLLRRVMDFGNNKSIVNIANMADSRLEEACQMWELQFKNKRDFEFNASYVEQVMSDVAKLLGILKEEKREGCPGPDEICSSLPPGYSFTSDYTIGFIKFVYNYIYNRSLESSKTFISMSDPLADIGERHLRSVSHYRQISAEANIDDVSKQIFDYATGSFVRDLGELIKAEACKADSKNPTFKSKRALLRTILTDLGQKIHNLTHANEKRENIFKEFMLYFELAESKASEDFFLDAIVKLLKDMLTNENTSETYFIKMVKNYVGRAVDKAKNALRRAGTNCKGRSREYISLFNEYMDVGDAIDFRISILDGFPDGVAEKLDNLYLDFLIQANYLFETLVCEDNKAAIRPLFEKIMGCRERCPFCSAPCSQSLDKHTGDHRANHYPMGVRGTVDRWGLFANTFETHDATTEAQRKTRKLALATCQTIIRSPIYIRTQDTLQTYSKWYNYWFNWNYRSFKNYKEVAEYTHWDIPYSGDPKTSLYWKWFMAQFHKELVEHYKTLSPEIPEAWKIVSWEEAKESLNEPDLTL